MKLIINRSSHLTLIATYVVAVILVLSVILPLLWTLMMSFRQPVDIITWPPSIFSRPTLENYRAVFASAAYHLSFSKVFINSIIITATSVTAALALASISAYALSRLRPKGTSTINSVILGVRMIPPIALAVPFYIIYNRIGLLDTRIGLILPFTALNIPLATWMLEGFFQDLPKNLEEAAIIDGCTIIGAFWRIILPLTLPGIAATSIFSFVLSWNNLTLPLPLTLTKAPTLSVLASQVRTEEGILWGQLGVITVVMVVPVILFTIFAAKYLVKGLTGGAVKG